VSCSEEFGNFLGANPSFTEIADPGEGGLTQYKQIYICIDGGVRFYQMPEPTRYETFIGFLIANPDFRGLTDAGRIAFGVVGDPIGISLFAPGLGFYLHNYIDASEYYIIYDPSMITPGTRAYLDANPSFTVVV
jgi:hypothetical protein